MSLRPIDYSGYHPDKGSGGLPLPPGDYQRGYIAGYDQAILDILAKLVAGASAHLQAAVDAVRRPE